MRTTRIGRVGATMVAALATVGALASPASATVHDYDVELVSGRTSVGSLAFDMPGGVAGCSGATSIDGTIDDVATTDNITGNLDSWAPFELFVGGPYALTMTGAATGANAGTYDASNRFFTGLVFPTVAFTVRNLNTGSCTLGTTTLCSGTMSLVTWGELYDGATMPLVNPESIRVNGTGWIDQRNACGFPLSVYFPVGAQVTFGDNPNDDVAPVGADGGAILRQA